MKHLIIACEGKKDRIFFQEMILSKAPNRNIQLKTYPNETSLISDISARRQATVSVVEGNGFDGCITIAVHLSRNLWFVDSPQSIGVVADSDHGSVYEATVKYLEKYLNTPCKKHNINPTIVEDNDKSCVHIRHSDIVDIDLWTFEIFPTLDLNMSNSLKVKHEELKQYENEDEVIKIAGRLFYNSEEEAIKTTVGLLENEEWFGKLFHAFLDQLEV